MPIRLAHWIEGVFNLNGLKRFLKKIPKPTKAFIKIGIVAVEALKKVAEDPTIDIFTEMTRNKVDDKIVAAARIWAPKVLLQMRLADKCLSLTNSDDIIRCGAEVLNQFAGDFKNQLLTDIAEQFAVAASDGDLTWGEIAGLVKIIFDKEYKSDKSSTH